MSTATPTRLMTTEEFLDLLDETPADVTLELINGEVRVKGELRGQDMTTRNPRHSTAIALISHALLSWLEEQSECNGIVAAGEARCRLKDDPATMLGIDVAYFGDPAVIELTNGSKFFDGPPILAVEVLSPTDTHEDVSDRIRQFLAAGVAQVWIADTEFCTITVHRPGSEPKLFTARQTLDGDPELPGFQYPVERLVGRTHTPAS